MAFKDILGVSALILGIVNGLILLRNHFRDKPKLTVKPVNPTIYQWWFKLPNGNYEGKPTIKYGFLVYLCICNRGLRKVSLDSWNLYVKGHDGHELKPVSIPEPKVELGNSGHVKVYRVLGQKGPSFGSNTLIDSGTSISGMAYYLLAYCGNNFSMPMNRDKKIIGKLVVTDIFGGKASCKILFSEKPLQEVLRMVEGIEKIDS